MTVPYSVHRPARNPVDAIRLMCMECQGSCIEYGKDGKELCHKHEYQGVSDCPSERTCALWPYRFGKNPYRKPSNPDGHTKTLRVNESLNKRADSSETDANPE